MIPVCHRPHRPRIAFALGIVALCAALSARGEEPDGASQSQPAPLVVARVAGEPIYAGEVKEELQAIVKDRQVDPAARPRLEAEMLAQLVDRRLVLAYLKAHDQVVDPARVEARVQQTAAQLKQRGSTLDAYLAGRGITKLGWQADLTWAMSWQDYVERHVTDEVLSRYFDAHRRQFDGSELRVSQILLGKPKSADPAALEALRKQADDIRQQIVGGKLTFEAAVTQYSTAPSKVSGGDLGFLARHGAMPEAIAAAAFALEKDQLSPPILTPFGVHLLRVTEVKPGRQTWREAKGALRTAVVQQGFRRIAAAERAAAAVEFTGAMPYLDAKTGRLVVRGMSP